MSRSSGVGTGGDPALAVRSYGVWLHDRHVGTIGQRGDYTWFRLSDAYRSDPERPVFGLLFEQDLAAPHQSALRLPPWFSNLLPEGALRTWIAADRDVSADREMELLAQVGHDLPGAVQVLPTDETPTPPESREQDAAAPAAGRTAGDRDPWRFSLAGVALKFSMRAREDRLTLPAGGQGGDWIVKLPDPEHEGVPRNEHTMMSLAGAVGIEVPAVRLVHRDELDGLPADVWPGREEWAYAVRRFDRDNHRRPVHIEDLAQVRGWYPQQKYHGGLETVAALVYRGRDLPALREFARRLAFNVLVGNGDAHLKNWSLIYRNPRVPTLSPAYDLVATEPYAPPSEGPEDLGLRFGKSKRFGDVHLAGFARLERKLNATGADLVGVVTDLVEQVRQCWPDHAARLEDLPAVRTAVGESIRERSVSLLRR